MRPYKALILIILLVLPMSGCSSIEINNLKEENQQLKQNIVNIEKEKVQLNNKLKHGAQVPSIMYSAYEQKLRLVLTEVDLHIYFGNAAPVVNTIKPNTVVTVLDAGLIEGEDLWLYVEIPVYDIPDYYKGWIREADTVELTEQNKKLGYDSVSIKEGVEIYNCDEVEDIAKATAEKTTYGMSVRIERIKNGYAYVFSAGGWNFWVDEKHIIYAYDLVK